LVGVALFTNKGATHADVTYQQYFKDQELAFDYAWERLSLLAYKESLTMLPIIRLKSGPILDLVISINNNE